MCWSLRRLRRHSVGRLPRRCWLGFRWWRGMRGGLAILSRMDGRGCWCVRGIVGRGIWRRRCCGWLRIGLLRHRWRRGRGRRLWSGLLRRRWPGGWRRLMSRFCGTRLGALARMGRSRTNRWVSCGAGGWNLLGKMVGRFEGRWLTRMGLGGGYLLGVRGCRVDGRKGGIAPRFRFDRIGGFCYPLPSICELVLEAVRRRSWVQGVVEEGGLGRRVR